MSNKKSFVNVNIGVDRKDKSTIDQIENELNSLGIYYDNDGGDENTYNINAGFENESQARIFEEKWEGKVYVETETFE